MNSTSKTVLKSLRAFRQAALSRLLTAADSLFSVAVTTDPVCVYCGACDWREDHMIGMSDMDAAWYYERRRWQS